MVKYNVKITKEAMSDLEELYNYISYVLLAPENAIVQYNRITDKILKLENLPERYKLIESEVINVKGVRRMPVDNFSVFYIIKGDDVIIIKILYSASNIEIRLKKNIEEFE